MLKAISSNITVVATVQYSMLDREQIVAVSTTSISHLINFQFGSHLPAFHRLKSQDEARILRQPNVTGCILGIGVILYSAVLYVCTYGHHPCTESK